MFESFRYRTAFAFGRAEHLISRILFVMLLITFALYRSGKDINIFLITDILLWICYWVSHRLEKWAHPNH